jgi:hypothetical protein
MSEANKWVPKVGDKVRIKRCWLNGLHAGLELVVTRINEIIAYTEPHPLLADEPAFLFDDIEPAAEAKAPERIDPRESVHPTSEQLESFAKAWGAAKADPYERHRILRPETRDDSLVAAMTERTLANELARKRNIAALAQELRRPAPVRFPHPGRNFELKGGRHD